GGLREGPGRVQRPDRPTVRSPVVLDARLHRLAAQRRRRRQRPHHLPHALPVRVTDRHDFEEVLPMFRLTNRSADPAAPIAQPRPSRRLRRRTKLGLALSAGLLPLGAVPFLSTSGNDVASSLGASAADAATTCVLPQIVAQNPAAVPPCSTIQPSTTASA